MSHNESLQFPSISGSVICISVALSTVLLLLSSLWQLSLTVGEYFASGSSFLPFLLPPGLFCFFQYFCLDYFLSYLWNLREVCEEVHLSLVLNYSGTQGKLLALPDSFFYLCLDKRISPLQNTGSWPRTSPKVGQFRTLGGSQDTVGTGKEFVGQKWKLRIVRDMEGRERGYVFAIIPF